MNCTACHTPQPDEGRCANCGALLAARGYQVKGMLAVGPRGRVYKAKHGSRVVALKELAFAVVPDTKTIEHFEREAMLLRALSHPRIPEFVESFVEGQGVDRRLYLAQSFVEGENLETRLEHHFFDEREARRIAADVLDVLIYLHTRSPKLIHRDVKPSNIIARPDGSYGVVDFGTVRVVTRGKDASTLSGTFGYMPPEQLARRADARSDLYALGVTLARVLSRRPVHDLLTQDLNIEFRPYVNVSLGFAEFLERLTAKQPEARYSHAGSALEALKQIGAKPPEVKVRVDETQVIHMPVLESPRSRPRKKDSSDVPVRWVHAKADSTWAGEGLAWFLIFGGQIFGLRPGMSYLVGRSSSCDVCVDERLKGGDTVSREHVKLTVERDGLRVVDLYSSNGTQLGALPVVAEGPGTLVREPVQVRLGKLVAELRPGFHVLGTPIVAGRPGPPPGEKPSPGPRRPVQTFPAPKRRS